MQALGHFIIDDDTIDCRQFQPRNQQPSKSDPKTDADRDRLLGVLLHEIETTGTLIACATSIVNYAARHCERAPSLFASLPVWLPSTPPLMGDGTQILIQSGIPFAIINQLHSLRIQLGVAGEATRQHCSAVSVSRPAEGKPVDDLIPLWQVLSESTIELLHAVRSQAPAGPNTATAASADRLLTAAALGAWPCVTDAGLIEIPGWIERRGDGRHRLRIQCALVVEGRSWTVETTDISRFGTGLAGLPQLALGTKATLRIGRRADIAGSIVWSAGNQGGFRFDQPLASVADLAEDLRLA